MNFFDLKTLQCRYRPFPIGRASSLFSPETYEELLNSYPAQKHCVALDKVGSKFTLSERFNPQQFQAFLAQTPIWQDFHRWIKAPDFAEMVLSVLKERGVDLGLRGPMTAWERRRRQLSACWHGRSNYRSLQPTSRMEFSMLPSVGGHVIPHADGFNKIVTLVVSMQRLGEWDQAWGGGTDLNRPLDERLDFNRVNRQLGFDEVEVLETFPFEPNQAVVFVKTFNSWHSVRPMTGSDPSLLRRTLTINIELPS